MEDMRTKCHICSTKKKSLLLSPAHLGPSGQKGKPTFPTDNAPPATSSVPDADKKEAAKPLSSAPTTSEVGVGVPTTNSTDVISWTDKEFEKFLPLFKRIKKISDSVDKTDNNQQSKYVAIIGYCLLNSRNLNLIKKVFNVPSRSNVLSLYSGNAWLEYILKHILAVECYELGRKEEALERMVSFTCTDDKSGGFHQLAEREDLLRQIKLFKELGKFKAPLRVYTKSSLKAVKQFGEGCHLFFSWPPPQGENEDPEMKEALQTWIDLNESKHRDLKVFFVGQADGGGLTGTLGMYKLLEGRLKVEDWNELEGWKWEGTLKIQRYGFTNKTESMESFMKRLKRLELEDENSSGSESGSESDSTSDHMKPQPT